MNECQELLWQALHSKYGIKVETSDPARARQQFYRARKTDPQLSCITVVPSPFGDNSIYLVKRNQGNEEEPGEAHDEPEGG